MAHAELVSDSVGSFNDGNKDYEDYETKEAKHFALVSSKFVFKVVTNSCHDRCITNKQHDVACVTMDLSNELRLLLLSPLSVRLMELLQSCGQTSRYSD